MKSFQLSFALFLISALAGLPSCLAESGARRPPKRSEKDDVELMEIIKGRHASILERLKNINKSIEDHQSGSRLMKDDMKDRAKQDVEKYTQMINDLDFLDNPEDPANKLRLEQELVRLRKSMDPRARRDEHNREDKGRKRRSEL
eukprot:CAMPEP_0197825002 /NCGR_PEP_ID=MMETSP1437-20131217/2158_1 /TAXON_ID=49252 ORGANISM="Eucampia antarctica, Strain CCMP1452" /NCGR_SAMPLE_ID=MMETSP1437 /ASSEMBLY_ACC=CAM_ASM_001096 /LENGTH=144 /DNA_ID=CAMNT_0043424829 /DNA_START=55 /DNA_END=489 /DNA_ORIENTATION=+